MNPQRNTEQKRIIFDALERADHPTASQLYEFIKGEHPNISRATVFRVLSQFADCGKIRRIELIDSDTRFDARPYAHAHLHCDSCGRIVDVLGDEFDGVLKLKSFNGFEVSSCELEFYGRCPNCCEKLN